MGALISINERKWPEDYYGVSIQIRTSSRPWVKSAHCLAVYRKKCTYRVQQKEGLRERGGSGDTMGGRMYSFHLNISPEMSCGVFEGDSVLLQNDMLTIL